MRWDGIITGVRAAWARLVSWEPLDWEDSGFPDTQVIPGTPDPSAAIWAGLSAADQVRLAGLVTGGPQLRFDWGPGPYSALIAAGLAEHSSWEGQRGFGHPAGCITATHAGELAALTSGIQHRVRLHLQS